MSRMPDKYIDMGITSPPYWKQRDYGLGELQLGNESNFLDYIMNLCDIFDEVKRPLKDKGSLFVNLQDTYNGNKNGNDKGFFQYKEKLLKQSLKLVKKKQKGYPVGGLLLIPQRFTIEMVTRGWIVRNVIIWHKPNQMPDGAQDRFTVDYEYLIWFTKQEKYYFNKQYETALSVGKNKYDTGYRNKRCVWDIPKVNNSNEHYSAYPEELLTTPIKACCPTGGIVCDLFMGSGTTASAAYDLGRNFIGSELSAGNFEIANKRLEVEMSQRKLF